MKWLFTFLSITCLAGASEVECYFDRVCLRFLERTQHELIYRQDNNLKDHKYQYLLGKYDAYIELLTVHQGIMEHINE